MPSRELAADVFPSHDVVGDRNGPPPIRPQQSVAPLTVTLPAPVTLGEIRLTDAQFRRVAELVTTIAGIQLSPGKESLVRSRLAKRLRALGLPTMQQYLDLVERDGARGELAEMVDALTTNKTSFFREGEHFRLLTQTVFPELERRGGPIRIWSAGCSTGEEPYSIAMAACDALGASATRVRILATDISARVLRLAREAEYPTSALRDVAPDVRLRHFEPHPIDPARQRVVAATRRLVDFQQRNLLESWPREGPFDVILCRNVMIYFGKSTQELLVSRFTEQLASGGYLYLGHAESLSGIRHGLEYVQPATFRR